MREWNQTVRFDDFLNVGIISFEMSPTRRVRAKENVSRIGSHLLWARSSVCKHRFGKSPRALLEGGAVCASFACLQEGQYAGLSSLESVHGDTPVTPNISHAFLVHIKNDNCAKSYPSYSRRRLFAFTTYCIGLRAEPDGQCFEKVHCMITSLPPNTRIKILCA